MRPNSVRMPVANTTARARACDNRRAREDHVVAPRITACATGRGSFSAAIASPVIVATFTRNDVGVDHPAVRGHLVALL